MANCRLMPVVCLQQLRVMNRLARDDQQPSKTVSESPLPVASPMTATSVNLPVVEREDTRRVVGMIDQRGAMVWYRRHEGLAADEDGEAKET